MCLSNSAAHASSVTLYAMRVTVSIVDPVPSMSALAYRENPRSGSSAIPGYANRSPTRPDPVRRFSVLTSPTWKRVVVRVHSYGHKLDAYVPCAISVRAWSSTRMLAAER